MTHSSSSPAAELNSPTDLQEQLQAETISALRSAHTELLKRFAKSIRNQFRVEIILFRSLLAELAAWAESSEGMSELAHKASWWESYWYEREYGDSGFEDLSNSEQQALLEAAPLFNQNCVGLWAVTLRIEELEREMVEAAVNSSSLLLSLGRLSKQPDWSDLSYVLQNSGPTMRTVILEAIAHCVLKVDPATYNEEFLDFLRQLDDSFEIRWSATAPKLSIAITTTRTNEVVSARASMDPHELMAEMARSKVNPEVDAGVRKEAETDIASLFAEVEKKAA